MEKGKLKKNSKELSIVIVPHSSGNVKTLKFNRLTSGLLIGAIVMSVAVSVTSIVYGVSKTNENIELKSSVAQLVDVSIEQQSVIVSKDSKITSLRSKDDTVNTIIGDFLSKYRNITSNFITNRSGSSRNSTSRARSFAEEITGLKQTIQELKDLSDTDIDTSRELNEVEDMINNYLSVLPSISPASGSISSPFGWRTDPISYSSRFHDGVDIDGESGDPVYAPSDGTVSASTYKSGYGLTIEISHGYGIDTNYCHLSESNVKSGQKVKKGQIIGRIGCSGRTTGSHLHFMVLVDGVPVNPLSFLN